MTSGPAVMETEPAEALRRAVTRGGVGRAAIRVAALGLWTGACFLLYLLGRLLTLPSRRLGLRWRHRLLRGWSRGFARLLGMRVIVRGERPSAPFFLVANHLSYVDIILLYTCLDCVFVAKREMRSWPGLGFLAEVMGTIWVRRESRRDALRVLERIDAAIRRGDGVVLFAEGTTSAGESLLPMKPALFDWAARREHPVHCAALTYRTPPGAPPARLAVCWWGDMTFGPHVFDLCRLPRFEGEVTFTPTPLQGDHRGALAERVRDEILRHFAPVATTERHMS